MMRRGKISVYDRNAELAGRKACYWISYRVDGMLIREPARATRRASQEYAAQVGRLVDAGSWVHPRDRRAGRHMFETYATEVIERRIKRGVKTAEKDESGHVRNHLQSMFAGLALRDITFAMVRERFGTLRDGGDIKPRTLRNIHSTFRSIMLEALDDELVANVPPALSVHRGHLPRPDDTDWRDDAVFTREEVVTLLGCSDIPVHHRVLYALLFLTGARLGEILAVKVGACDLEAKPSGAIRVRASKLARKRDAGTRRIPIHPDLARWLQWWVSEGYEIVHGHSPRPDNFLLKTTNSKRLAAGGECLTQGELWRRWRRDLIAAGLRHRRMHDARRTFISAARSAAVDSETVRKITHASISDSVIEGYTTLAWEALCKAVNSVKWGVPGPVPERFTHVCTDLPPNVIRLGKQG